MKTINFDMQKDEVMSVVDQLKHTLTLTKMTDFAGLNRTLLKIFGRMWALYRIWSKILLFLDIILQNGTYYIFNHGSCCQCHMLTS